MKQTSEGVLLRIYLGEEDKLGGKPLFEQIVLKAQELKLAGATVLRGLMGFGADSHMHTAKILRLSENLPVVIEIVDAAERLAPFQEYLDGVLKDGVVTLEKVQVLRYRQDATR